MVLTFNLKLDRTSFNGKSNFATNVGPRWSSGLECQFSRSWMRSAVRTSAKSVFSEKILHSIFMSGNPQDHDAGESSTRLVVIDIWNKRLQSGWKWTCRKKLQLEELSSLNVHKAAVAWRDGEKTYIECIDIYCVWLFKWYIIIRTVSNKGH